MRIGASKICILMIKNNFIYLIMSLFEKGAGFLLLPLYSLYLSPSDLGIVSLMSLLLLIVTSFSTSIMSNSMHRFYLSPNYEKKKLLWLFFILLCLLVLLFSSILFICNSYIAMMLLKEKTLTNLVNLFIINYIFSAFVSLMSQVFILEQKAKVIAKINIIKALTILGVTSIGLYYGSGVYAIAYGLLAGNLLQVLLLIPKLRGHFEPTKEMGLLKEPLKYSYPLIIGSLSNNLIQLGDRYILNVILGLSAVGIYTYSYTIATIVSILLVMPNKMAMQPVILAKEAQPEKLKYLLNRYAVLFFSLGLIFVIWFSAFSKEFVSIISSNEEFTQGWVIIPIIAFSHLLHGLGNYLGFGILMAKRSWMVSTQTLVAAFVNVGLNFLFIPFYGIIGAAFATMVSYLVWNYLKRKNSQKHYGLNFDMKKIYEIFFIGIVTIGIIYLIEYFSYHFIFKIILLLPVSWLLFMRYVSVEDREKLYSIIQRGNK